MFESGSWGTVCADSWDLKDANVVCRQLGFEGATAATYSGFRRGIQGLRWKDDVRCRGNETSLTECPHNGWTKYYYCYSNKDAGAVCITGNKTPPALLNKTGAGCSKAD